MKTEFVTSEFVTSARHTSHLPYTASPPILSPVILHIRFKAILLVGLIFFTCACSPVSFIRTERLVKVPVEPVVDRESRQSLVPVAQLLSARQVLCRLPARERDSRLRLYRRFFVEKEGDEKRLQRETGAAVSRQTHLFYALMLASCEPQRTPGAMVEMLAVAETASGWPEEHEALIDLLKAEREAYSLLNTEYRDLRRQHEKTIQGIKNIEAEIDKSENP